MKKIAAFIFVCFLTAFIVITYVKKPGKITVGIVNIAYDLENIITIFQNALVTKMANRDKTIEFIYEDAGHTMETVDVAIESLFEKKPDIVVSFTTPVTLKVKKRFAKTNTPIVFVLVADPVGNGLVKNFKTPGGDFTGIRTDRHELKRLEWVLKIVPGLKKMYIGYNPDDMAMVQTLKLLKTAVLVNHIEPVVSRWESKKSILDSMAMMPEDVQVIWQLPSPGYTRNYEKVIQTAIERRKPLSSISSFWVEKGALLSFGINDQALGKQISGYVDNIIHGISPSDLPVEHCELYLSVNLKTARKIGLTIPDTILHQARKLVR